MAVYGIITNVLKDSDFSATKRVADILVKSGAEVCFDSETASKLGSSKIIKAEEPEIIFVLGGDGTLLRVATNPEMNGKKLFGLNLGRLGFLTEAEACDFEEAVKRVLNGDFIVEKRTMLAASVGGETRLALNEAAVTQHNILKMVQIEVYVNNNLVYNLLGDGVIISSATGSTGYSLSAGGPILAPELDNIVLTPVCAHTVKARSVVVSGEDAVKVIPRSKVNCVLSLDGESVCEVKCGEAAEVKKAGSKAQFIKLRENNFYSVLNRKLTEWD